MSELLPNERQNIQIRWTTLLRCDNSADKFLLINPRSLSAACQMGGISFDRGSSGVEFAMNLGDDGLYHHELKILDIPCNPGCMIDFQVQSGIGGTIQTSGTFTFSHDSCGVSIPLPNN